MQQKIDRRALNSAKQKSEDHLLTMGEVCALCQHRLGTSRSTYYRKIRPLIADDFKHIDAERSGKLKRMQKGKLLTVLDELGEKGFPG